MLNLRIPTAIAASMLLSTSASANEPGGPDPLFATFDIVELTITAPMEELLRKRPDEEYLPGTLTFSDADGNVSVLDIGIRTRGNYRRQKRVCPFPPLRVNIKTSEAKGTLFHKQDKLKLVTHCRDRSARYEQNLLREYLAYRILNTMTDISYRVRLLRVNYVDSLQKQKDREQYAFVIEHKNRLAHRTGVPPLVTEELSTSQLEGAYSDLSSLFQFMIGNTDFSPIAGAEGETCCHNSTPFGAEGAPVYSIPYDFDMSGFVNAPYAEPNPRFKIRSVTQRLYRGRCRHIGFLDQSVRAFQDSRAALYRLVDEQQELDNSTRKSILKYMDKFYAVLDDPKRLSREIRSKCI